MHIFLDETLPFWKAGNKMRTVFMCGLSDEMQIVQNLQTFAYFNTKTDPKTKTGFQGVKKPKPKSNIRFHNLQTLVLSTLD